MNLEELQFAVMISRIARCWSQAGRVCWAVRSPVRLLDAMPMLCILDRDMELAQKVIERFPKVVKGRAVRVYGDVLNAETLHQANETIKAEFGAVDILINAAGGNHPSATTSADLSFFDLPLDALRHVGDLNLLGTILPCQVFGRGMAERGEGVILNISSMNALSPAHAHPCLFCGESGGHQFHAMAGCPHGAELFAAHPRQCHCAWIFS